MEITHSSVDSRLEALVLAAEGGKTCPRIRVLTGGWLVQGIPVGTQEYLDLTATDLSEMIRESKEGRRMRGNPEQLKSMINGEVSASMAPFNISGPEGTPVLSLKDAILINAVTLKVPAVRVPLSSVQAWWSASMLVEEAKRYSSAIGVGISF